MSKALALALSVNTLAASSVLANPPINEARAHFHYQMHCQGCHIHDGSGTKSVPDMRDHIGRFLASPEGRAYLVQVPGSANSVLSDSDLAEVLNWILIHYAGSSLPHNWRAYKAEDVAEYRKTPLLEVVKYRQKLLRDLSVAQNTFEEK